MMLTLHKIKMVKAITSDSTCFWFVYFDKMLSYLLSISLEIYKDFLSTLSAQNKDGEAITSDSTCFKFV